MTATQFPVVLVVGQVWHICRNVDEISVPDPHVVLELFSVPHA